MAPRIAITAHPPLLEDLLRVFLERAGMDVTELDTTLDNDVEELPTDFTITVNEGAGRVEVVDATGFLRRTTVTDPDEIVQLVRSIDGGERQHEAGSA